MPKRARVAEVFPLNSRLSTLPCYLGGLQTWRDAMAGQGSAGNVLAAPVQLFHSRPGPTAARSDHRCRRSVPLGCALWIVLLGWLVHIWSVIDAARWKGVA